MKNKVVLFWILFLVIANVRAGPRVVTCRIESDHEPAFRSECLFISEGRGSFSLTHPKKDNPIMPGVIAIEVSIVSRDIAEVRGLTTEGINSRWGTAKRSVKNKACWKGEDFKICAW